jgi:LacI family transcriptional regulator
LNRSTTKPATIIDVAKACGLSTATVSRVLRGPSDSVAPTTAAKVLEAVSALSYTPSAIGQSLRTSTTRIVVLMVPDATNDFCADVAISLEGALQGLGLSMVLCNVAENPEQQDRLLADAESLRPYAIVLLGAIDTPKLQQMAHTSRSLVFVNRRPPPPISAPFVGIDNLSAGRAVAAHLFEKGLTRCAIIHGPRAYSASRSRLEGFLSFMADGGIAPTSIRQIESALTMEAGYEHGLRLLRDEKPPRAVFCGNDMIAYGIHRAAEEVGVKVPEQLAIVGFDDNRVNAWLAPWLTTVHVPALDFGPAVASMIGGSRINVSQNEVILPFTLTIRHST